MKKSLFVLSFFLGTGLLSADLLWEADRGWYATKNTISQFEKEPAEAVHLMNDARQLQEAGNINAAMTGYTQICKKYKSSLFAPEAYYQLGKLKLEKCQFNDAFSCFETVVKNYPEYPRFQSVLEEEFALAQMIHSGKRPKYFGVIPGLKDYKRAIDIYRKVVQHSPHTEIASLALLCIGDLSNYHDQMVEAIKAYEQIIEEYPYSKEAPEAYLKTAGIYAKLIKNPMYDQGATLKAMEYYQDFLTLYPKHPECEKAQEQYDAMRRRLTESKILAGDFYFQARNNRRAATIMYVQASKLSPDEQLTQELKEKVQFIVQGGFPQKTPVDFLFGRYQKPTDEDWLAEAMIDNRDAEFFELKGTTIATKTTGNATYENFGTKEEGAVTHNFISAKDLAPDDGKTENISFEESAVEDHPSTLEEPPHEATNISSTKEK